MNELASILPRYGGGPLIQKMKVIRAGGTVEFAHVSDVIVMESPTGTVKRAAKAVKEAPHTTGFVDARVEQFTDREAEIESFADAQEEKKSLQSSVDPESVAEVKRGRKPKVKE